MIVRMKKITILVSKNSQRDFLNKLRKKGAVHVKHLKMPSSEEITQTQDKITLLKNASDILSPYKTKPAKSKEGLKNKELIKHAWDIVETFNEKEYAESQMCTINDEIKWFAPWGGFDPENLESLKEKNIFIRLYRIRKNDIEKIEHAKKQNIHIIKKEKGNLFIAFVSSEKDEKLDFDEIYPPKRGLDELKNRLTHSATLIKDIDSFFNETAYLKDAFRDEIINLEKTLKFLKVDSGMGAEEVFSYLQGYCPEKEVKNVIALCKSEDAGYLVEDPDDPDEAPTLIKNPRWVDIISPVFKFMNTLPGYIEYDISLPFLVFFSLFFAMLIGDAGYGILFLAVTYLVKRKAKKAPGELFYLLYLLSAATIAWGVITGTYFGVEKIAELPILSTMVVDRLYNFQAGNQNFMIYLCFIIGAVHLSLAHLMQIVKTINSITAIAQAGWILVIWGLFFAAGTFVIGNTFPEFAGYLLAIGAFLVLLFSNAHKNFIKGIFITLADLPLKIISSFSDVVSYLRLFAVGYASFIMAKSFNDMALAAGFNSVASSLGAAFILFFGHTLNIALGLMAIIVHGIRLNMLEFSGHLNMQWSGKQYEPFKEE